MQGLYYLPCSSGSPGSAPGSPSRAGPPLPSPFDMREPDEAGGGKQRRPIRLLTFSTLYPNPAQPHHGVFVENRLRHLVAGGEAESTVLALVPGSPAAPRRAPPSGEERRHGLAVHHPRFPAPPGIGMYTNPFALLAAARARLSRMVASGFDFDVIDAHYLYPDGVAAVRLAREFGRPVVITARGSDTSQLPAYAVPGRLIRNAIARADALVAVSAGLADGLFALGAPAAKVTVLRNGVDLGAFRPVDRAAARAELGLDGRTLLSVGC